MRADTVRVGRWHQAAVYAVTGMLVVSGLVWGVLLHYFGQTKGVLVLRPIRWKCGCCAYTAVPLWRRLSSTARCCRSMCAAPGAIRRNIYLGITLIVAMLILTITAYLLYYAGSEETRPVISAIHWIIGVVVAPLLTWHVISGRAQTRAVRKYSVGES